MNKGQSQMDLLIYDVIQWQTLLIMIIKTLNILITA